MDANSLMVQDLSLSRALVGIVCIPNAIAAAFLVGSPAFLIVLSVLVRAGHFMVLLWGIMPVILLSLPGIWLAYGYTTAFLRGQTPLLPWSFFWGVSAVFNAVFFSVSAYCWVKWGYPGKPVFPFIDQLLIWLPLDGGLICLWQLSVCILSLVIVWKRVDPESLGS